MEGLVMHRLHKAPFHLQGPFLYASVVHLCKEFSLFPRFGFHQNSERQSVYASVREGAV
jgi:hypothetical protein